MGYQGRPNTIIWILIRERKKQESQSEKEMGLPWWSSDYDCASTQGLQVPSLVRELRSHVPCGAAKNDHECFASNVPSDTVQCVNKLPQDGSLANFGCTRYAHSSYSGQEGLLTRLLFIEHLLKACSMIDPFNILILFFKYMQKFSSVCT